MSQQESQKIPENLKVSFEIRLTPVDPKLEAAPPLEEGTFAVQEIKLGQDFFRLEMGKTVITLQDDV